MTRFRYSAILTSGQRVGGTVKSRDRREALKQLIGRGYHPLDIERLGSGGLGTWRITRDTFRRVTASHLRVLTKQLASLLRAGLPMVHALATLRRQSENRHLVRVIQDVEESLSREGGTLADALDEHPRIFDGVYRGLVRAGEEGGNLAEVLENLAGHLARSAKMRGQIIGAFIYPIFLLLMGTAAVFVLMTFVIPRFREMFEGFGQNLPLPTQVLIAISTFMATWWWAVLGCVGIVLVSILLGLRRPYVRQRVDHYLLRTPALGTMFLKLEISRICRTLGSLLTNGVRILEALRITGETVRNRAIRKTFPGMVKAVSSGESLATAAEKAGLYPPIMLNLIRTGEDTGELPEMLGQLSSIYEEEADRAVAGAVKLLEPSLIIVMGGVIAAIVAAVMLPIFQTNVMVQ